MSCRGEGEGGPGGPGGYWPWQGYHGGGCGSTTAPQLTVPIFFPCLQPLPPTFPSCPLSPSPLPCQARRLLLKFDAVAPQLLAAKAGTGPKATFVKFGIRDELPERFKDVTTRRCDLGGIWV